MKNQFTNVLLTLAGVIIAMMMVTVIYLGYQVTYYKALQEKTDTTTVVSTDTTYKEHYFVDKEPEQKTEYIIKREVVYQKLNEDSTVAVPREITIKKKSMTESYKTLQLQ